MKTHANKIIDYIQAAWSSYLAIATRNVLSQWLINIIIAAGCIWTFKTLFPMSFSYIIDLMPEIICHFICNYPKLATITIIIIMLIQIYMKYKHYKCMDVILEIPYDSQKTYSEKLRKCDMGINRCESRKEILSVERDFIKSFSPIPIVTAILGYILEKAGITNFNWHIFVLICLGMIMMYLFLCINNIRKCRYNQFINIWWHEAKYQVINREERK